MRAALALGTLRFAEPLYLWLLLVPAGLLPVWLWQAARRWSDARRHARLRVVPAAERFTPVGDLAFWLCLIFAIAGCVTALARPEARISAIRNVGADLVILQDASASMYVDDVTPDRWRRSQQFVRALAEALSWRADRVALALFAHRAAPQLRLTRDPNSLFFFLDHLSDHSPFSLEDSTAWDTNIEEGVYWGLRLVEKDEELFGKSQNAKGFIVVSDGQAWSGRVQTALGVARQRRVPVYVVGIGTTTGGLIPEPAGPDGVRPTSVLRSVLDRNSLQDIARAGGGDYFELGREPDRDVAFRIIEGVRGRAPIQREEERYETLYWRCLFAAALCVCAGTLLLKHDVELWWQTTGALAAVLLILALGR
jgi:Ca-activated chloride channel homolog